jgi:prepilin peptidase CpaA
VFAGSTWNLVSSAVLAVLLALACASDLRTRRIPNKLVLVTAVTGLVIAVVTKPVFAGLIQAGAGFATGLAIWFPFYAFRMLGAGDVKLFAAAATFLGARAAAEGALFTALYGGVLSLVFMVIESGWAFTALRVGQAVHHPALVRESPVSKRRMPYALAIAAGVLTALWAPGLILS